MIRFKVGDIVRMNGQLEVYTVVYVNYQLPAPVYLSNGNLSRRPTISCPVYWDLCSTHKNIKLLSQRMYKIV